MTNPATETKPIGLPADAQLSWFLHLRQDNYFVTRKLPSVYRDSAIWTNLPGRENSRPSTGTLQKRMPTLNRRQLPIPPGRYKKYAAV
jgi:hypothetical protein